MTTEQHWIDILPPPEQTPPVAASGFPVDILLFGVLMLVLLGWLLSRPTNRALLGIWRLRFVASPSSRAGCVAIRTHLREGLGCDLHRIHWCKELQPEWQVFLDHLNRGCYSPNTLDTDQVLSLQRQAVRWLRQRPVDKT